MAKNQSTYTLKIDAELGSLQNTLNQAKKSLEGFMASGNAPKGIEKAFEKINALLGQITDKAGKPMDLKGLTGANRDLDTIQENFRAIVRLLGEFDDLSEETKLSFVSPEEQKKVKDITSALQAYGKAADDAAKKIKSLEAARKTQTKEEGALDKSKKKVGDLENDKTRVESKLTGAQGKLDAARLDGSSAKDIAKYEAEVGKLRAELEILDRSLGTANEELTKAQTVYDASAKSVKDLESEIKRMGGSSLKELKEEAKALGISFDGLNGHDTAKQVEILSARMLELKNQIISGAKPAFDEFQEECKQGEEAAAGLGQKMQGATESVKQLDEAAAQQEAFEAKIKSFLGLSGAAQVLRAALRDALQTITELDATMADMAVVTDLDIGDYWNQLPEYTERANKLGLAIGDVYEADTLFYQQGLKTNEVVAISTESMKMAKIAGLDTADATDRMTAALRGFNMELNEASAQKVADVYSELAAITASDVDEISKAMTKTASIASSAGMEFETTAAFLSQIIETTRETAETAGTAMKTVIARFQELKKDPSEIGEVDGEIVDANAIETALRSVGVSLRDASGQFRDLDDVFMELSSKWSDLDKNTQRYIATIAAGSRQQSRFIAMMSDYQRTANLVAAANNSAGASTKQFEKKAESLEFKLNQLKNAWHEFTMGIMNSELVKIGIDILTKFLDIVNKTTSGIQGIGGSLVKVIGIFSIFKMGMKIFNKIETPLMKLFKTVTEWAGTEGFEAGKKYAEAAKAGAESVTNKEEENEDEGKDKNEDEGKDKNEEEDNGAEGNGAEGEEAEKGKGSIIKSIGSALGDLTGVTQIIEGIKKTGSKKRDELKNQILDEKDKKATKRKDEATARFDAVKDLDKDSEEYKEALNELNDATEEFNNRLELADEEQQRVLDLGKEGWTDIADGIGKLGGVAQTAGMGISALGGALQELGLEDFGKGVTSVGNIITLVGTGVVGLGFLITGLGKVFKKEGNKIAIAGTKIQLAWWWVAIIVAAIVALIVTITLVANALNSVSPETKLKQAEEAAQRAAEAADDAANSFNKLNQAFEKLENKYDALEALTRGTKEWNSAVQEINSSVLDLIEEYPELAKFVENKEGVLTINLDSEEVQQVLNQAEAKKVTTQNQATMANLEVSEKENALEYSKLSEGAKVDYGSNGVGEGIARGTLMALDGAAIGAIIGAIGGPIGAGIGAAIGGVVGTVGGIFAGIGTQQEIQKQSEQNSQEDTDNLARALASGEIKGTEADIAKELESYGYTAEQAKKMAVELAKNVDQLRAYGDSLLEHQAHSTAAFEAIASSAQSLANTLSMSEEQIRQSRNLVDGEVSKEFYDEKMAELDKTLKDDTNMKYFNDNQDVNDAVEATYGKGAYLDDSGVVHYKKDGVDVTATLTRDEIKSMVATQYATKKTTKAIEVSDEAIAAAAGVLGDSAINKLYSAQEGKALTQADMKTLQAAFSENMTSEDWYNKTEQQKEEYKNNPGKFSQEIQDAWQAIVDAGGADAYANNITNFVDDLAQGVYVAQNAFAEAEDVVSDFMTADMALSFKTKLDEVAELIGGEKAKKSILEATEKLLSGQNSQSLTEDLKRELQNRINMTDWTSLESLLALQIDLEQQYGFLEEEAKEYVDTLASSAFATSKLVTTIEVFGNLWKATEKINQSMQRLTQLQWEYNRAINDSTGNIKNLTSDILAEYSLQGEQYAAAYDASNIDIAKIYAQGGLNYGVDLRKAVALDANGIQVDKSKLQEFINSGAVSEEDASEWLEKLNDQYKVSQDQLDGLRKTLENIEELEQQGQDAFYDLRDMAKEAILSNLEEQIELERQTVEAINDGNLQLVNQIQKEREQTRQEEQNKEVEKDISDLNSQLAFLGMDTSGASDLKQLEIQKQIADLEKTYQDTLIDQAIQNLVDSNEVANTQRERQITIAETQLELYKNSAEFQQETDRQMQEMLQAEANWRETELGQLIAKHFTEGLSSSEVSETLSKIGDKISLAHNWLDTDWIIAKEGLQDNIKNIEDIVDDLPTLLTQSSNEMKTLEQKTKLTGAGFSEDSIENIQDEETLNKLSNFVANQNVGQTVSSSQSKLKDAGITTYDSQSEWISNLEKEVGIENILAGVDKEGSPLETYEDYLKGVIDDEKHNAVSTAVKANNNTGLNGLKSTQTYQDQLEKYLALGGNSESEFDRKIVNEFKNNKPYGHFPGTDKGYTQVTNMEEVVDDQWWFGDAYVNGEHVGKVAVPHHLNTDWKLKDWEKNGIQSIIGDASPSQGWAVMYNGEPYVYNGWTWGQIVGAHPNHPELQDGYKKLKEEMIKHLTTFKTGGLADFTGPAWLDGTPSRPEYILNAKQTERFFSLINVLEGLDEKGSKDANSGDNYFNIEINVEKLESDYDVEQIADKIRKMIHNDATYRNVNAINLIR